VDKPYTLLGVDGRLWVFAVAAAFIGWTLYRLHRITAAARCPSCGEVLLADPWTEQLAPCAWCDAGSGTP
jgi:hypothetical protein